jgi:hypothetical protein
LGRRFQLELPELTVHLRFLVVCDDVRQVDDVVLRLSGRLGCRSPEQRGQEKNEKEDGPNGPGHR